MRPSALVTALSILLGCAPGTGPQPTAAGGVDASAESGEQPSRDTASPIRCRKGGSAAQAGP